MCLSLFSYLIMLSVIVMDMYLYSHFTIYLIIPNEEIWLYLNVWHELCQLHLGILQHLCVCDIYLKLMLKQIIHPFVCQINLDDH